MNPTLTINDIASLAPLLILLVGALGVILIESISSKLSLKLAAPLTFLIIILAAVSVFFVAPSKNPLLTLWLSFDSTALFFTLFFLLIGAAIVLLSWAYYRNVSVGEYYFFLLSCLFGLVLIGSSADFLTLFLGIETLSIALYILCGYLKMVSIAHESSIKYFLIGTLGTAFLLYGIALIYGATGTTQFNLLATSFSALAGEKQALFLGGIALVTLGLCFKATVVPFHVWAPDVYQGASTPVVALMAVGTKVASFAAFFRIFLEALPGFYPIWNEMMALLAYATLIFANFVALLQTELRRFFAYSGISHAGFLLLPLIAGGPFAKEALLFYLVVYALATLGAFSVLVILESREEGVLLSDFSGLFNRSPMLTIVLSLCLLTLGGIPPTVGFFAKFLVFKAAFQAGYIGLVVVGLLTTVLSAFYYLRIVSLMFSEPSNKNSTISYSFSTLLLMAISVTSLIAVSLYPAMIYDILPVAIEKNS